MALLTIIGDDGKPHLVHSSMIGPVSRQARSVGRWEGVWARGEREAGDGDRAEEAGGDERR